MLLYSMQHGQDSNNFQTVWLRIDPVSRHRDLLLPPSAQKPKSKPRRRAIPLHGGEGSGAWCGRGPAMSGEVAWYALHWTGRLHGFKRRRIRICFAWGHRQTEPPRLELAFKRCSPDSENEQSRWDRLVTANFALTCMMFWR
jgi:hypothetical protein